MEFDAIRNLIDNGFIVAAVGGGGIPVIEDQQGTLQGVFAVIDKDRASSLLASDLKADMLVISTAAEQELHRPALLVSAQAPALGD